MGATYTRQSSFTDGDVITSDLFNNEYDQLLAAFASSSGHTHDGTAAEGGPITKLLGTSITIGDATSGTDITVTFDGESNDGVLKWMEDEDYFEFSDDLLIASTEKIQFRDTAIYINSSTDGQLDLVADSEIQIAATTIDINGNVDISGTLTIGGAGISEAELEVLDGLTVSTTEVNILDGDTSATSTTVADADRVVLNDNGTMVQVAVTDLAAYFDDEITAMPNLVTTAATTVGALNSGSITSGFGTIDTGSSTITTTGLISGGSLDIDDVLINGSTIGHTDDTDLITVASGLVTVAGEVSLTTLDIGGTNVTSTAAELNILDGVTSTAAELNILDGVTSTAAELNIMDGDTSASSTTVADADRVVFNDAGTMKQVAVTDLAAYFDDEITAMPNLVTTAATTVGALNSGSITSGFGTIDTGSSAITTTGLISGGSLDIDNVLINGTTIGHTDDTDLITVANGLVTVAGEISVTTLDIGGTNVTSTATELNLLDGVSGLVQADFTKLAAVDSTAAELNIVDGGTSATSTTVVDADRVVMNDNGTMVQVAVTDLAAYFDDEITAMPNLVTTAATSVGALDSGSITSGFGTIDTGSSNITTTGVGAFGSLDISGDIDVDGTTNLDAVDVDGAVNFAADVTFADGADIITASAGTSNFRAGVNAGNSIQSGGNFNTVLGDEAGTAITTGDDNVAVGYAAGDAMTTGSYNAIVGKNSGGAITTGIENVSIGWNSLDALTEGGQNVALGASALGTDTLGSRSVAVGYQALTTQNFTTATDAHNTAVGYKAGEAVTTGANNTIIGANTGMALTSGSNNNLIGGLAGDALTTGHSNNIMGVSCGTALTDADYNVAIGQQALNADTLGSQTVAIGSFALSAQNFTTATNSLNTAVGYAAGAAITTGDQNALIGGLAGDALTVGRRNTAIGVSTLSTDTKGDLSVAIGFGALDTQNFTTSTETDNTAVGAFAGLGVTSGLSNTLIGTNAGDTITTGDFNCIVGADSDTSIANAQARMVLGFGVSNPTDNSVRIGAGGNFISNTFTSNATWAHSSDERLKENIQNDTLGLSFIKDLRPVTFTWKKQEDVPEELKSRFEKDTGTHHGIIAQEVKAALDTAGVSDFTGWSSDEGTGTQLVSESMFVYPLIKSVQELSTALDAALARIAVLEG